MTQFECLIATAGLLFATVGVTFFAIMLVCRIGDTVAGNDVKDIMGNFDAELRELLDPVVGQPHQGPGGGPATLTTYRYSAKRVHPCWVGSFLRRAQPGWPRGWLRHVVADDNQAPPRRLAMSRIELAQGSNPDTKKLAQAVIDAQSAEITLMNSMRRHA